MKLTKTASARRRFILANVESARPRVLEIGAFDNPTFHRAHGDDVQYLDYSSAAELRAKYANSKRDVSRVVEIDYVVKGARFAAGLPQQFDVVVANHVVEHVPDLIQWFDEVRQVLRPGGMVALSVPDRRFTFDYFRPPTLATHLLRARGAERADKWQIAEHLYYHSKVDLEALWRGEKPVFTPRSTLTQALDRAEKLEQEYTGVHCWVFTLESWQSCIADLRSVGAIAFVERCHEGPNAGDNEFRVLLTPAAPATSGAAADASKTE